MRRTKLRRRPADMSIRHGIFWHFSKGGMVGWWDGVQYRCCIYPLDPVAVTNEGRFIEFQYEDVIILLWTVAG